MDRDRLVAAESVDTGDEETDPDEPGRVVYLDSAKVALTIGVIVAHAAMTYGAAGTWVYEEPSLSGITEAVLSAAVGVGVLFGLGLFFLIAGTLTTGSRTRHGPGRFLASRWRRLGLPLLAYAVVIWPVLQWLRDRVLGETRSLVELYRLEFGGTGWQSLGTGPLWFVAVLLVMTTGWTAWRRARPAPVRVGSEDLTFRHLAVTTSAIAVSTYIVRVWFPVDSTQFLDLHVWLWPQSAALFVLGAIGSERGWMTDLPVALRRQCFRAALAGGGAFIVLIVVSRGADPLMGGWHWEAAGFAAVEGALSVSLSLIVLDLFRRHQSAQGRLARRLARDAYGAFVAQGPVLVCLALALRPVDVSGDVKFVLLATAAVLASFGLAGVGDIARRWLATGRGSVHA